MNNFEVKFVPCDYKYRLVAVMVRFKNSGYLHLIGHTDLFTHNELLAMERACWHVLLNILDHPHARVYAPQAQL
jgi:hypothetical protein